MERVGHSRGLSRDEERVPLELSLAVKPIACKAEGTVSFFRRSGPP
jgi:hypothetical protein